MPKRYYWLKLKENFFEDETIKLLKAMENGKDYIIFLLQLRLKSINTEGHLNFKDIMPYNEKMLATITDTNIDIVRAALKIFEDIGLISRLDNGTIYMEHLQELIGSESSSAARVRKHRELQYQEVKALPCNSEVTKCNTEIEIDIDTEKDTEKEREYIPYPAIINHLNTVCGTQYKHSSKATQRHIKARWNEGYRLEDFQAVIDIKAAQWKKDKDYSKYLRPQTLFSPKFEAYLNERKSAETEVTYS